MHGQSTTGKGGGSGDDGVGGGGDDGVGGDVFGKCVKSGSASRQPPCLCTHTTPHTTPAASAPIPHHQRHTCAPTPHHQHHACATIPHHTSPHQLLVNPHHTTNTHTRPSSHNATHSPSFLLSFFHQAAICKVSVSLQTFKFVVETYFVNIVSTFIHP